MAVGTLAPKPKNRSDFLRGSATTKVDVYGWEMLDSRGQFLDIDKRSLVVNHAYQRGEIEPKILAIARAWSWAACLAIGVARRDGLYYVYDGQQRVAAARRRADIDTLPCMVFDLKGTEEEAAAFLQVNTFRKPVTAIEKFNADLITRDSVSLAVKSMIEQSGYVLSHPSKTNENRAEVRCITTLKKWARTCPAVLQRCWPLIVAVAAGKVIHQYYVESIVYIELALERKGTGESLLKAPWKGRLLALGSAGVLEACSKAINYHMKGGARVYAEGVVNALNRGVRNKLYLIDVEEGVDG